MTFIPKFDEEDGIKLKQDIQKEIRFLLRQLLIGVIIGLALIGAVILFNR